MFCLPGAQRLIIAATGGGGTALAFLLIADNFGGNKVLPKSPRLKRGALWAELPHFVPWLVFLIMFTLAVT